MNTSPSSQAILPGLLFRVSGRWAHFKKPETNNNPLTHDFITKTALLGLMGAVMGVERLAMRPLFPQWSDDLLYGVQLQQAVRKVSWSFTLRNVVNQNNKAPKAMELLKNPEYLVAVACRNERSEVALQNFATCLREHKACYTPVLGLHNCPAELEFIEQGTFEAQSGAYRTKGFARRAHGPALNKEDGFRLGFENIPTWQSDDQWNRPDRYAEVCYGDGGREIALQEGDHFHFTNGDSWCLV